jgi:hypothetical protein
VVDSRTSTRPAFETNVRFSLTSSGQPDPVWVMISMPFATDRAFCPSGHTSPCPWYRARSAASVGVSMGARNETSPGLSVMTPTSAPRL